MGLVAHAVTCPLISSHTITSVEARCNVIHHRRVTDDDDTVHDTRCLVYACASVYVRVDVALTKSLTDAEHAKAVNDHFYSTQECQTILSLDRRERRQINTYR